jgi:hypothetical protein
VGMIANPLDAGKVKECFCGLYVQRIGSGSLQEMSFLLLTGRDGGTGIRTNGRL